VFVRDPTPSEANLMPSLDHESFGRLRHRRDEGWVGWVHLPQFAECHDTESETNLDAAEEDATTDESVDRLRAETRQARRQQKLAEGRFQLVILDPEQEGPTDSQQEAFDFLIEHEGEVLDSVLHYVLDTYCGRGYWTLDGFVREHSGPAAETLEDLKKCLRLESVVILQGETGRTVPITFFFSSPLDEEHGVEVTRPGHLCRHRCSFVQ
jgi:hypothetical protein